MSRQITITVLQSLCCIFSILLGRFGPALGGTEFSEGWVSGPILECFNVGILAFCIALLMLIFFRRVAAAVIITASLLCLPLYAWFIAPGFYRLIFTNAVFDSPPHTFFRWNTWAMLGLFVVAIGLYSSFRYLLVARALASSTPSARAT